MILIVGASLFMKQVKFHYLISIDSLFVTHGTEAVSDIWGFVGGRAEIRSSSRCTIRSFTCVAGCAWAISIISGGGLCRSGVTATSTWCPQRWWSIWRSSRASFRHNSSCGSSCSWGVRNWIVISPSWWSLHNQTFNNTTTWRQRKKWRHKKDENSGS